MLYVIVCLSVVDGGMYRTGMPASVLSEGRVGLTEKIKIGQTHVCTQTANVVNGLSYDIKLIETQNRRYFLVKINSWPLRGIFRPFFPNRILCRADVGEFCASSSVQLLVLLNERNTRYTVVD